MKKKKSHICPYCESKQIEQLSEKDVKCLKCGWVWNPDFLWINRSIPYFLENLSNRYKNMNEQEKEDLGLRARRFMQIHQSSRKIKEEDPITSLGIILIAMEEIVEIITRILSKNLPDSFKRSHEVKLTPYVDKKPFFGIVHSEENLHLIIDISGELTNQRKISEEEFFKLEKNKEWKSPAERFGAIFKHGRYFRSERWEDFAKKEYEHIDYLSYYLFAYALVLIEKEEIPSSTQDWIFTGEGGIIVAVSIENLNDYMKNRKTSSN